MAAFRRSPSMRDQWRADGEFNRHRGSNRHYTEERVGYRERPSPRPHRHTRENSNQHRVASSAPRAHPRHRSTTILSKVSRGPNDTRSIQSGPTGRENGLKHQVRPRNFEHSSLHLAHSSLPRQRRSRSPSPSRSPHPPRHNHGKSRDRGGRIGRGGRYPPPYAAPKRSLPQLEHGYHQKFRSSQASGSDALPIPRRRPSRSPVPTDRGRPLTPVHRSSSRLSPSIGRSQGTSPRSSPYPRSVQRSPPTKSAVDQGVEFNSKPRSHPSSTANSSNNSANGDHKSPAMTGMRSSEAGGSRRQPRPHVDTRQPYSTSPQYIPGADSRHSSPQSGSPYSGRGSWTGGQPPSYSHGQQRPAPGYSPPYRQSSYSSQGASQGQYYQSQQSQYPTSPNPSQPGYSGQSHYRGSSTYRGNPYSQPAQSADRRYSASNTQSYSSTPQPPRSRSGHFTSLQWTASGGRGRGSQSAGGSHPTSQSLSATHHAVDDRMSPDIDDDDDLFRPSKDLQVEDEESVKKTDNNDSKKMPPPRQSTASSQPRETGKFSFAFKSKAPSTPVPKPVSGLAQKMREPPRPLEPPKKDLLSSNSSRSKHDSRAERREDRRDRDTRRTDHRFDRRDDRRRDRRDDWRPDLKQDRRKGRERHRERSPIPEKPKKKILTRMKPRPTLSEEFAKSDSVYYRKPGNESVVGAGTYGKVFKAVHIFTKNKVALKRIRMEGEKDGFPITAVREIRLLQHLRHENIVSLHEVMVEKNECFMVFEYLSHDMTGLINHPSFTLSAAHKKHLAKQMFEGLNYLHHRGVLHRDIKAANILISNRGELKFADFGLARFFSKGRQLDYTNRVITIWYRPPELLLGETRYGPAVDVWSAACVYMEMFTKKAIFPGDGSEINQLDKLYNSLGTPTRTDWPAVVDMPWFELLRPRERKRRNFEETFANYLSSAALDLVRQIFQYDPVKRPTTEEVLAHPYFTEEDPAPQQAIELADVEGDWHEFESKAHRKEKDKEARRAEQREREKRRISSNTAESTDRERKRTKVEEDTSFSVS